VSEESIVNQVWQTLAAMYILATASNQMRPDEIGRATHNDNTATVGRLTIANVFDDRCLASTSTLPGSDWRNPTNKGTLTLLISQGRQVDEGLAAVSRWPPRRHRIVFSEIVTHSEIATVTIAEVHTPCCRHDLAEVGRA
jgi:hypothetical protein